MSDSVPNPPAWLSLAPDERVWLVAAPSTNLVLGSLTIGFVLLIVMSVSVGFLAGLETGRAASLATLVAIVALLGGAYGLTRTHQYVLTSERALVGAGVREKRVSSVDFDAIADVQMQQSNWQRLLDVGTVQIATDEGTALEFRFVENPEAVSRQIRRLVADDETEPMPR